MIITKERLQAQKAEMENQAQVSFINHHRAQAVALYVEGLMRQLDEPEAPTVDPSE